MVWSTCWVRDRLEEKGFLSARNIAVAPYHAVTSLLDLESALASLGRSPERQKQPTQIG